MTYLAGDYYLCCDVCGFKIRRSAARRRWDGAMVCGKDWEPRHPQDSIRAPREAKPPRDTRPDPEPVFLTDNQITPDDL